MSSALMSELSMLAGFAAGFASSLHCVGMCGGITAGLMLRLAPDDNRPRQIRTALLTQLGRIVSYTLAGAVLAGLSSQLYLAVDREAGLVLLRWAAAITLVYMGLSVAGMAPQLAGLDRLGTQLTRLTHSPWGQQLQQSGAFAAGMVWGLLPCGMVYAALFFAMLSADPLRGALIMAGFGLGTLPALLATSLSASFLLRLARRASSRIAVGVTIICLGVASAAIPWRIIAALCGFPIE